ncbi:RNA polymerase sigma-70 factor (sigma-E family) [Haloactinopolyspora alba]|uniref:RNA polymerase sigma-70 factor (Sigma-E family) n=1 Tax=Haloactinopolyspora alba TaxID=648780 RepID=A0A2P8DN83_9ACTN|nr:SigE family RNA polymerase sigma factor [Haloactinopolyspora alba]PSK98659.1 RNA polymerase sigma-70 factor (sigma-E family) [Haloactinopolyspora alba]
MFRDMDGQAATSPSRAALTADDFEDWVRVSSVRLRRLAYLLTGNLDQAEDLLQSAYAKVLPRWRKISTYDSPEAYMYRVMVNLRTSWWRRSRNREWSTDEIPEAPWRAGTPGEGDAVVESQALLAALRALPERQRAAVVLRHWCDLSEAQTAEAMNCSVGTVKSNASRGLAHLRAALAQTADVPGTPEGDPR